MMEPDKVADELTTIRVMLTSALSAIQAEKDRVTRELEQAAIVHDRHDGQIRDLRKILTGNGEKGLLERHRDLEDELSRIRTKQSESREDTRWLARAIVTSTIGLIITLTLTAIARGG